MRAMATTTVASAAACRSDRGDDGECPTPTPSQPRPPWRHVATAFVSADSAPPLHYALVKRSETVSTYHGKRGAISGGIEAGVDSSPAERAATEVEEEVGLDRRSLRVECRGRPLEVDDGPGRRFVVHPVRFRYVRRGPEEAAGEGEERPLPPLLRTNWESTEAAWVSQEELSRRETVPRLLDALWRTMPPPASSFPPSSSSPSPPTTSSPPPPPLSPPRPLPPRQRFSRSDAAVSVAVAELVGDRARGASQLARVALRGLRDAAAAAAAASEGAAAAAAATTKPAAEGGGGGADTSGGGAGASGGGNDGESEEAAAAWELCADWGFALAASRPSMAPLSTSVASALVRAADEKRGGSGTANAAVSPSSSSPSSAVFVSVARAAAEEEAKLIEASKQLVSAGVEALRGALSRWRLRQRRQEEEEEDEEEEHERRQQRGQGQRRHAQEAREKEPPVPRIVTISFSSVVRDTLVALIKEVSAEAAGREKEKERAPSPSSPSSPSPSPLSSPLLLRICVCEGRPLCEGATLAEELAEEASRAATAALGAPAPAVEVELCTDAAGPALVREEAAAGRERRGGSGFLPAAAAAAVVLGADAVYPEAASSIFSGVVNKVGSRALVEAAASLEGSVPAFALAGRAKVSGGGAPALAEAGSGSRAPRSLEENSGDELLIEDKVRKGASGDIVIRNPYFESVPLRLLDASGGGVVVEAEEGGGGGGGKRDGNDGGGKGDGDNSTSSSFTLLTARDVASLAERADERARAAFRMDWL